MIDQREKFELDRLIADTEKTSAWLSEVILDLIEASQDTLVETEALLRSAEKLQELRLLRSSLYESVVSKQKKSA